MALCESGPRLEIPVNRTLSNAMHHTLRITPRRKNIKFHLLLEGKTKYFETNYTYSFEFSGLFLFSLVSSEAVIYWAILVFYHPNQSYEFLLCFATSWMQGEWKAVDCIHKLIFRRRINSKVVVIGCTKDQLFFYF